MTNGSDQRALIRYALVGLALTVAGSWVLYLIRDELLLLYIAVLVAIGLSPVVSLIERPRHRSTGTHRPRWAAIFAIYLCLIAAVGGVGLVIVPPLADQSQALWAAFPDILHRGQLWLLDRGLLARELSVREAMQQVPVGSDAVGAVVSAVGSVFGGLIGALTVLLVAFYLLVDADGIVDACLRLFPVEKRSQVREASLRAGRKISAWLGGQLLVGTVIGATTALSLGVMGVPYFYVLALIAGIGELIPMVGPILSAIPAVAVALTVSPGLGLAVLVFFIVQQQVENNLLVPKIMARQVGVSALTVIIALLIGTSLLGVVGAILAVPTAAILQVLFEELLPGGPERLMRRAWHALVAYTVIALVATWPLVGGLARDVAGDLGDSLLNMWILSWDCEQLLAILQGDVSRFATFFDANIFHPAPLTLAYSEHLLPQALQVLPFYALTGNPILCYNLLFLSAIILSALGMYLLVRQLTGHALAGFVAGLLFAFAPYRLPQYSHVQVLSAQWMPFVLYGIRRYFDGTGGPGGRGRRVRPLLWAAVALAVQNLSCGYYLLYFGPFAVGYALWEMVARRAWTERRTWMHLAAAGMLVAAMTAPFLLPYAEVRARFDMARTPTEVARLSADVYAYATTSIGQPLWGSVMRAMPKPEGELFPGLVPIVLGVIGLLFSLARPSGHGVPRGTSPVGSRVRRAAIVVLGTAAILHLGVALATIGLRRINIDVGLFQLRIGNVTQMLVRAAAAYALVLALSSAARQRCVAFLTDRGVFFVGLIAAFWLSLGPVPHALGRPLDVAAPYGWLFDHVPGFEGLRVPARYGMIVTLMLAVLGGYGAAIVCRRRWGPAVVTGLAALFLLEGTAVPFLVNGTTAPAGYHAPEARVYPPDQAPLIYRDGVRRLEHAVLAELPLGEPDFDLRAIYYSTAHWAKMVNGYSGFYPPHYGGLAFALRELPLHPALSIDALRVTGATHVIVHEGAYLGREGEDTSAALRAGGAVERYRDGGDVLLALPR